MADVPAPSNLVQIYAAHPLREQSILDRIARQRGTLDGITQLDLATDTLTEITDQNHVGGMASVVRLAMRAGVAPHSRVLDLGSGLGGSPRVLAWLFGCRAEGVELSPLRHADAVRLTARVRLDHLVTCTCGDALSATLASGSFDVVWGQGAWMHIADTRRLLRRITTALVPGGRVAFEEACLERPACAGAEAEALSGLERLWAGRFLSRERWLAALGDAGLDVVATDDLTGGFLSHFERLALIARTHGAGIYPAHETAAFDHAVMLTLAGAIHYRRFVARRP
jgi:SAM-dependent methyltransferase